MVISLPGNPRNPARRSFAPSHFLYHYPQPCGFRRGAFSSLRRHTPSKSTLPSRPLFSTLRPNFIPFSDTCSLSFSCIIFPCPALRNPPRFSVKLRPGSRSVAAQPSLLKKLSADLKSVTQAALCTAFSLRRWRSFLPRPLPSPRSGAPAACTKTYLKNSVKNTFGSAPGNHLVSLTASSQSIPQARRWCTPRSENL